MIRTRRVCWLHGKSKLINFTFIPALIKTHGSLGFREFFVFCNSTKKRDATRAENFQNVPTPGFSISL